MFGRLLDVVENIPLLASVVRQVEERFFHRHALHLRRRAGEDYARSVDSIVQHGIFKGMKLAPSLAWGADKFGMLAGQYEQELYPLIAEAAKAGFPCFIDIGCANGFYAVGVALLEGRSPVIAYDIDEGARQMTRANADLNGVGDRVEIKGLADHDELQSMITRHGGAFILCDIEGAETELLDPERCPALRMCDLLVELHGDTAAVGRSLTERFQDSHVAEPIRRAPRNPFNWEQELALRFENDAWMILSEGRNFVGLNWLLLKRK